MNGRSGEIRTPDPLVPNQMRYQAALHSESLRAIGFRALEGNPRNDKNGTNAIQWQGVARKVQPAAVLGTSIASPARKLLELSDPQPVTNDTTSEFFDFVLIEIRATDNLEKA